MRDGQLRRRDDRVPEQQDVDVDGARAFFLDALPAHLQLDLEQGGHQLLQEILLFPKRPRSSETRPDR